MSNSIPLYQGIYQGPEGKELTVSLKTAPCRFNCIICAWKQRNSYKISDKSVQKQIESVISKYKSRIREITMFSFGNEGSLLDEKTLNFQTLLQLTKTITGIFPKISFETHVAFITQDKIEELKKSSNNKPIEFTVALETRDNYIRQKVLRKGIPLALFEKKIELLLKNDISIKTYIMLKPSPYMNEEEGIEECVRTIKYLNRLGEKNNKPITIHLNPTFIPKGSKFEAIAIEQNYTPPKLWSIAEVLHRVKGESSKIHLGLSTEGTEPEDNYVFGNCTHCTDSFTAKLKAYNKHHNIDALLDTLPKCYCRPHFAFLGQYPRKVLNDEQDRRRIRNALFAKIRN